MAELKVVEAEQEKKRAVSYAEEEAQAKIKDVVNELKVKMIEREDVDIKEVRKEVEDEADKRLEEAVLSAKASAQSEAQRHVAEAKEARDRAESEINMLKAAAAKKVSERGAKHRVAKARRAQFAKSVM